MRALYPFEIERNALAVRVGTNLPKPRKLKVQRPGFSLGSCERLHFTPDGAHLIVVTVNGTFLWDVATGERRLKLAVPSNPSEVTFSVEGTQVLIRNEQSQFMRLSIPDGEVLAKFKAKHPLRMDGTPGLGPGNRVLQLAYQGRLLELDGTNGKVLRSFQLDATGCSGENYWFPQAHCWIVSQRSRNNGRGRSMPCALWRWDEGQSAPRRLDGEWDQLNTTRASRGEGLLLHHAVEPGRSPRAVIEHFDVASGVATLVGEAPMSIISLPSLAHDGRAFGVARDDGVHIDIEGKVLTLPDRAYVQFHPTRDLVGISGRVAFVARRAELAQQLPELEVWHEERELGGRAYSRLSTLGGSMPARLVVFAHENQWLVQAERIEGLKYIPLADPVSVDSDGAAARDALVAMLSKSRASTNQDEPATEAERRPFHGGTITPPTPGWASGVAVALADDAIDVWPLKPTGAAAFSQDNYPVAALAPNASADEIVSAVQKMLAWYKPRRR